MTTEHNEHNGDGSIDAVAASLLVGAPSAEPEDDEQADQAAAQPAEPAGEEPAEGSLTDEGEDGYDGDTDDDADDDEGGHVEEPQKTYRVKVDGAEVEATLEDLTRSYAGQGYIQKRMQEVAAVRREAEAVYTALNEERAQLAQALATYQQQIAAVGLPQPPSKELLATDPIGYLEQEVAYRDAVEQQQAVQQQQQALLAQQAEQNQRAHQAYLATQAQELVQRIPEFGDATKAAKIAGKLAEAGEAYGYSADDLKQVSDARALNVLYDAMRYRQLIAQKGQIAQKTQDARPFVKPGAKRTDGDGKRAARQTARAQMKNTGSVDDVANFLLH
jgi:hypothetical protein